jgi:hypothetical protein
VGLWTLPGFNLKNTALRARHIHRSGLPEPTQVPVTSDPQMAVLDGGRVAFKPLPGAAVAAAPEGKAQGFASQLLPAAALALGAALIAIPSTVLGSLVGGGAEGVVGALLECAVFGYILLQGAGERLIGAAAGSGFLCMMSTRSAREQQFIFSP